LTRKKNYTNTHPCTGAERADAGNWGLGWLPHAEGEKRKKVPEVDAAKKIVAVAALTQEEKEKPGGWMVCLDWGKKPGNVDPRAMAALEKLAKRKKGLKKRDPAVGRKKKQHFLVFASPKKKGELQAAAGPGVTSCVRRQPGETRKDDPFRCLKSPTLF